MSQAVLSICINIAYTFIVLAVKQDVGTGGLLLMAVIAGIAILLSISGLLILYFKPK